MAIAGSQGKSLCLTGPRSWRPKLSLFKKELPPDLSGLLFDVPVGSGPRPFLSPGYRVSMKLKVALLKVLLRAERFARGAEPRPDVA